MIQNASRKFAFAAIFLILTVPAGHAIAQSSVTVAPAPIPTSGVVTGTNPEPQGDIVEELISLLFLA